MANLNDPTDEVVYSWLNDDVIFTGYVKSFDFEKGLGEIESDNGLELVFHCTQISDGSRSIEVNQKVIFELKFFPTANFQAANIKKI